MVLQREMAVPIWGTASAGEQVSVTVASQTKTVTAPANGKWSLKLDPMPAGGPYVVTIKGTNTVELEDVYVGEVSATAWPQLKPDAPVPSPLHSLRKMTKLPPS